MKTLLDTHTLLWYLDEDARLGGEARRVVESGAANLSDVSLLEISIKVSTGKLIVDPRLHTIVRTMGFERTGIDDRYLARLERLPRLHGDPFDRFLIAQALTDDIPVLTADRAFAQYGVKVIDAGE
ncbi:MAG: type II toxin-antitoxin system VapC family toxin [Cryobacterium sp.]|nr:type II toxin-antitoxin system VapC family toxin [Cryobacterium sp.]